MSAADKQKLDAFVTNIRSLRIQDTTAQADQGTEITNTMKWTIGGVTEAITAFTLYAATTSKAGLMSAADKTALDTLPSLINAGYLYAGIATPSTVPSTTSAKIFYLAIEGGTYTGFNLNVTQGINIIYKSGDAWSVAQVVGIDNEPTAGSDNLVKSGGVKTELALGAVYDVSAHNNGATFESLSALLSDTDLNALIPTAVRKGGMSIKFVQSSDNKYVQYRLMANTFSTIVSDWQRVDGLFPLYRNSVSSFQYPYNIKNTISDTYAKGIIELYIDPTKYSSNDIRLRTFRNGHTSTLWEGKRYELIINDGTSDIFGSLRFDITPSAAEFLHNSDWSVCVIVNWLALEDNTGYGAKYDFSPNTTLSEKVKDLKNSLVIQRILENKNLKSLIDNNVNLLSSSKQDYISGNATTIDKSLYTQNGSISRTTGLLESSANRRSLVDFPVSYGTNYLIINNIDTASGKKISFWKENDVLSRVIDVVDMTHYILTCREDEIKANITLISVYGEGNVGRYNEIKVYNLGTDTELKISRINNIPIVPESSADLEQHLQANNPHHISTSMIGALSGVKVNGSLLEKDGTTVSIPAASSTAGGIMSKEDKQKLDNIVNPGTINISGSGVTKNASAFGFLPTNTAAENVTALQSAVTGGGTILVDYPGTYLVNDTVLLDSNTTIIFGAGVYISLQANNRFLLNRGALTKEYNENISIVGLNIITNNHGVTAVVPGLRGYIAFFYIKHLYIDRFTLLDGASSPYVIHICTFEDIKLTNLHIEGYKDAVHIGRGSKFVIRNGIFKTYDDPIALNAHDYPSGQPEYGWIEDGIIENCYDLADPDRGTTGYFARILAGSWSDWMSGNEYQINGDLCVSNNRLYQTTGNASTTKIISTSQPNHESGSYTYPDGLTWRMVQDSGVGYNCGCRRVHFKDIFLQKPRGTAFSIHFDNDGYSRSYYPNSTPPVQEDLIFENLFFEAEISNLISCVTPINVIKLINSILQNSKINLTKLNVTGITYIPTHIIMIGTTFKGSGNNVIAQSASGRDADIKILGSVIGSSNFTPSVSNVTVISNDIGL